MLSPRIVPAEARVPDRQELAEIYARDFAYVWRSVRRLGVPAGDRSDVTQDVFVMVFRKLWSFDRSRPFRPWLFGVLMRVVSDHRRLARHAREVIGPTPEVIDRARRPDEAAELAEEWRVIDEAFEALDVRHRAVLIMHDFEGHTARDIASALKIPIKTAFSRLAAARRHFTAHAARSWNRRSETTELLRGVAT